MSTIRFINGKGYHVWIPGCCDAEKVRYTRRKVLAACSICHVCGMKPTRVWINPDNHSDQPEKPAGDRYVVSVGRRGGNKMRTVSTHWGLSCADTPKGRALRREARKLNADIRKHLGAKP